MGVKHLLLAVILFAASSQVSTNVRLPTPKDGCGYTKVQIKKILGGGDAKIGAWPWIAQIGYLSNSGTGHKSYLCGGSLITSRHVLTAAHCIDHRPSFVRLGEHDIMTLSDGPNVDVDIKHIEIYPGFNKPNLIHDIALLTLVQDVKFTDRVRPICLPFNEPLKDQSFIGSNPFVAGWGRMEEYGHMATVLQQVQLPIIENKWCIASAKRNHTFIALKQFGDNIICAGDLAGGLASCKGDSGGPLMLPVFDGKSFPFYLFGIVSWSNGCGRPNAPGVFTRVPYYIDWIEEKINEYQ